VLQRVERTMMDKIIGFNDQPPEPGDYQDLNQVVHACCDEGFKAVVRF
jgi:hypothetical protein